MVTSSNTYNFGINTVTNEYVTEAFERIGLSMSSVSGEQYQGAFRSLSLIFSDWTNRGANLWTVFNGSIPLVTGTASYPLPTRTIFLLEVFTRTITGGVTQDLTISPISRDTYHALVNKQQQSQRPVSYYFERLQSPNIVVWPVPSNDSYTLEYNAAGAIEDIGEAQNRAAIPARWSEALVGALAVKLAAKYAPDRLSFLQPMADESYSAAAAEDRERGPWTIVPSTSGYFV